MTTAHGSTWRHPMIIVAVVAVGLLVAGCGDDGSRPQSAASGRGATLYQRSCASCHGADLSGTSKGPSHLSQVYEPGHHPDDSFRAAIARGAIAHHWNFGNMPAVPGLNDDEVDAVIAYIRAQQEARGFEAYPPR